MTIGHSPKGKHMVQPVFRCSTWLVISLTLKGVVLSLLSFLQAVSDHTPKQSLAAEHYGVAEFQ